MTLTGARDYYRKMADDQTNPAEERALWSHLADEIDAYLAREYDESAPAHEGAALW